MSYLALARKWRPTKFSQVVGQAHVLTALENALQQNRLHHAYLFSGTRGVGKTTIGRLFAKGLNCETGITSMPCGKCAACQEIDQGRFVDLLEIDAASRTKVEDTRELLDNVQYKPARGRFKVYLIDEVHMLSRHSFNALLKTLEEPPEYVKFLLATTDPQKLPVTILSRCLQFHLKPITIEGIERQLIHVLDEEQVSYDHRALSLIAHAADGSMRDALSLTDQAIALGNNRVSSDTVSHMLGTIDSDQALHLIHAISSKQAQAVVDCVGSLAGNGVEWDVLLQTVASQLHRIAMYQMLPATLDKSLPDAEKIQLLSQALTPEDVQLFYQIAIKGRKDLPLSPTPRIGLEMTLLRMVAFRPQQVPVFSEISTQVPVVSQPAGPAAAPVAKESQPKQAETRRVDHPSNSDAEQASYHELADQYRSMASSYDAEYPASQPTDVTPPKAEETKPALVGLRHQLRSQRKNLDQSGNGNRGKKSEAASAKPDSVFERLAQRTEGVPMPHSATTEKLPEAEPKTNEPYQWRPTGNHSVEAIEPAGITPSEVKQALEHEKTPEMVEKLTQEVIAEDWWAALIKQLDIPKLVEQLALNSACEQEGNRLVLTLRSNQVHLNKDKAVAELAVAISRQNGENIQIEIHIGDSGITPLERREKHYQKKLETAFSSLEADPNVRFIRQRFAAELDRDSVRPI